MKQRGIFWVTIENNEVIRVLNNIGEDGFYYLQITPDRVVRFEDEAGEVKKEFDFHPIKPVEEPV